MLYLLEEVKFGIVSGVIVILIFMVICIICKLSRFYKKLVYKDFIFLKDDGKSIVRKILFL